MYGYWKCAPQQVSNPKLDLTQLGGEVLVHGPNQSVQVRL
jgi:hypothetical protein